MSMVRTSSHTLETRNGLGRVPGISYCAHFFPDDKCRFSFVRFLGKQDMENCVLKLRVHGMLAQ